MGKFDVLYGIRGKKRDRNNRTETGLIGGFDSLYGIRKNEK